MKKEININDKMLFPYTGEEAMEFVDRISGSLKIMNYTGFVDMKIPAPDIEFFPDDMSYYDPSRNLIHIGIYGIIKFFKPKDEAEFLSAINYMYGHEQQHRRSTADRPYGIAIQKGCEAVLEYIQEQVEPYKRKFRKESDYADFANTVLPSYNIYISWKLVRQIIAGLANSLEDGRIERIRANRWHGFAILRTLFRGKYWDMVKDSFPEYDDLLSEPGEHLRILVNQILSLSTCQLYEKGFAIKYAGTPLMDEITEFLPLISAGVLSGNTRGLIAPVTEISRKLAPYIFEVCKLSQQDMRIRQMLEQLLSEIAQSMMDKMPEGNGLSERDEDTDEGQSNAPFPMSDLMPPSFSETQTQNDNTNGQNDDNSKEKQGQSQQEQNKQQETNSKQQAQDGEKAESQDSSNKQDTDSNQQSQTETENQDNNTQHKKEFAQEEKIENNIGKAEAKKHVSQDAMDAAAKSVLEAMKEAAAETRAEAASNIESINANIVSVSRARREKEMPDNTKPISPEEMKDICDFVELKREYKVKDRLPAVLAQRGKVLRRKNERYFKTLSKPNISYLDSGSVDPSLIYSLGFGNAEIFRKEGKPYKADHCAYMLVDNSGSMYGIKREEACKAAAVIEEGFKGLIPLKIVAFDEYNAIIHEVIKNWDESLTNNMCWNFCKHGRDGAGNEDGYDIAVATRELMARPETKKLLLVLSDGTPGNTKYCHDAIASARKQGIQVIGIYFETGNCRSNPQFENMYEKDYICCPVSEIDENLEKIFKKFSKS